MDRQSDTKALEAVLQKYEIEVSMNQSNVEIKINPEQLIGWLLHLRVIYLLNY